MPVGLLHPALVVIGVLGAVVDNGAAAEYLDVLNLPQVETAEEIRAGRQIERLAAFGVQTLAIDSRRINMDGGITRLGWRRRAGEQEQHPRVVKKVARPRDGKLGRPGQFETDGLTLPDGANAKTPRLDIDAAIPESGLDCGDLHGDRAGDVETGKLITCRGMCHVHRLAIHRNREGRGTHLRGNRHGLNARGGKGGASKRKQDHEQRAKTRQEKGPRRKNEDETTVAPGGAASDAFAH